MSNVYLDTVSQDNFPGFPTTTSSTGEIVARDGGGYKAVVTGPGVLEIFVEGELKSTHTVAEERVDIALTGVLPVSAQPKVGTAVLFQLRSEGRPPVLMPYRFVQGEDFFDFETAARRAEDTKRRQADAKKAGISLLVSAASNGLNDNRGLTDATTYFTDLRAAVNGRDYKRLAEALAGLEEWSLRTAAEAFDILFEPAVRDLLLSLPNPTWFHRVVLEAAQRQKEPLPLKLESVNAFLQELRETDAGKLVAAKEEAGLRPKWKEMELIVLVRGGAIVQEPSVDGMPGALRFNPAFLKAGDDEGLQKWFDWAYRG